MELNQLNITNECQELESQLDNLDEHLSNCKEDSVHEEMIKFNIKVKLDEHYKNKTKGHRIRARAKWVEEGEQSTKYFLGLEKSGHNFNYINSFLWSFCHIRKRNTGDSKVFFNSNLYKNKSVIDEDI